jgi:hypothetical protein
MLLAIFGYDGTDEIVIKELGYRGPRGHLNMGMRLNNNNSRPISCTFLLVPHREAESSPSVSDWIFKQIRQAMHPIKRKITFIDTATHEWVKDKLGQDIPFLYENYPH